MAEVASRYARALVDVVLEKRLPTGQVMQELQRLLQILDSSEQLRRVWENPAIPAVQKRAVLDGIAAREGFSRPVRNFAAVLIDHRRIGQLQQIVPLFEHELDQRLGLAEAEVTSCRELADDEKAALEERLEGLTGKKVRARYATDRALLGGAVVKLGSTIYDGSVRGQLQKMKQQLAGSS